MMIKNKYLLLFSVIIGFSLLGLCGGWSGNSRSAFRHEQFGRKHPPAVIGEFLGNDYQRLPAWKSLYEEEEKPFFKIDFKYFSVGILGGTCNLVNSEVSFKDNANGFQGKITNFDDTFGTGGIRISDVLFRPEKKEQAGDRLTGGLQIYALSLDYNILDTTTNPPDVQLNEIDSFTLAITMNLKMVFTRSKFRPYLGIGVGPAWTFLENTRTTIIGSNLPVREDSRDDDIGILAEAFSGIELSLGQHLYCIIDVRWFVLDNDFSLFPDKTTGRHTTKMETEYRGLLTTFGLGLRF